MTSKGSVEEDEKVILVNERDEETGIGEKLETHRKGRLHRAFSIFAFNSQGQLLLQRRAIVKYHSACLWTNTCCGHPRPGEGLVEAAHRRLREEMGFDCGLQEVLHFTYKVQLGDDLFEHEYDHVFVGQFDGDPIPNPQEVHEFKWVDMAALKKGLQENPDSFTYWLGLCLQRWPAKVASNIT